MKPIRVIRERNSCNRSRNGKTEKDKRQEYIRSNHGRRYWKQGLDDYIVVDTKDVLLICHKEKEQDIKEYVAEVKRNKGDKFL